MSVGALAGPCGRAMLVNNYRRLRGARSIPPVAVLGLVLLVFVPAWGWRSVAAGGVFFGVGAAAVGLGMSWVTYWDRYAVQFAVPMAVLIPVAGERLGRILARWRHRADRGAFLGAWIGALMLFALWPGLKFWGAEKAGPPELVEAGPALVASWAFDEMEEGDLLIDCVGLGVNQLLLPKRVETLEFVRQPDRCLQTLQSLPLVEGQLFLVTEHRENQASSLESSQVEALGWERAWEYHRAGVTQVRWKRNAVSDE